MKESLPYGGYGGVDKTTKYTPPTVQEPVPQPSVVAPRGHYVPSRSPEFVPQPSITPTKERYVPPAIQDFVPQPSMMSPKGRYIPPTLPGFVPQPSNTQPKAHYIPPVIQEFVPQPSLTTSKGSYVPPMARSFVPQPATVPFTKQQREKLEYFSTTEETTLQSFFTTNSGNMLIRTRTDQLTEPQLKTFTMFTSLSTDDIVTYTLPIQDTKRDLFNLDGGLF